MIPCKESKCLKFPVCKTKRTIFCTLLYVYLREIINEDEVYEILQDLVSCYPNETEFGLNHVAELKRNEPVIIHGDRIMKEAVKEVEDFKP